MTAVKLVIFLFAILVPLVIIQAQESTQNSNSEATTSGAPGGQGGPGGHPTIEVATSSAYGLFENFPFKIPHFDLNALWPQFAKIGSRQKRSTEENSEVVGHPRARRSVVICNSLTQGGFRCTGCRQVRRCYSFNLGTLTTCSGLFPYCNNGVCSRVKGSLCSSTTSTSTSASTSSSSTSSTSSSSMSSTSSSSSTSSASTSTAATTGLV